MEDSNIYFAKMPVEEIGSEILERVEEYYDYLLRSGISTLWNNSHNQFYEARISSGALYRSGDHGEFLNMPANHYKSLLNHIKVLTTNQRPALKPRSINTDTKSTAACKLAGSLLDYYMREQKVEMNLKNAVDIGLKYGESYIAVTWDVHAGTDYIPDEVTGKMMKAGDLKVKTYLPHFIARDYHNITADENNWHVVIDFVNKFELAAQYPDMEDEIKEMSMDTNFFSKLNNFYAEGLTKSELVVQYTFIHKRTSALPEGRETILLDSDIILSDGPLPYKNYPLMRLAPEEQDFCQFGYTCAFDILAIQEALTALYSCVTTNQSTFSVQSILIPRGFNISVDSLTGGLNLIEYDAGVGKPEPINLTMTAPEVFNFMRQLEGLMQILVGISDVNRGLPPTGVTAGNALALLASQAIEFNSGLQSSYVMLLEDVGTSMISTLKLFANSPRITTISGKYNQSYLKEFKGEDLQLVNRVQVDIINPITKTIAGKIQFAESMVERGWIKNPQQYEMVMETGNLDYADETDIKELYQMRSENEQMMYGGKPIAIITDNHLQHINEHKAVLASPESRKDPTVVKAVVDHLMEHINLLKTGDPILLELLGQKPVASPPPEQPGGMPPPQAAQVNGMPGAMAPEMAATINEPKMPIEPLSGEEFVPAGNRSL